MCQVKTWHLSIERDIMIRRLLVGLLCLAGAFITPRAWSQGTPEDSLIAVSADIVEISGSDQKNIGFTWGPFQTGINFAEKAIPGIYKFGDFARQTALQASLQLLETEGKAQLLANPKVVVQANSQANFVVGGKQPYPSCNNQGCTAEFKDFGVILNIIPTINPNKKDTIRAETQLEVSNPDFSHPVAVGNTSVPSMTTRQVQTTVEMKSGETLVIGGFKQSTKSVTKTRIPYIGRIPLLGLLFTNTNMIEEQKSLFLFITMEIVK